MSKSAVYAGFGQGLMALGQGVGKAMEVNAIEKMRQENLERNWARQDAIRQEDMARQDQRNAIQDARYASNQAATQEYRQSQIDLRNKQFDAQIGKQEEAQRRILEQNFDSNFSQLVAPMTTELDALGKRSTRIENELTQLTAERRVLKERAQSLLAGKSEQEIARIKQGFIPDGGIDPFEKLREVELKTQIAQEELTGLRQRMKTTNDRYESTVLNRFKDSDEVSMFPNSRAARLYRQIVERNKPQEAKSFSGAFANEDFPTASGANTGMTQEEIKRSQESNTPSVASLLNGRRGAVPPNPTTTGATETQDVSMVTYDRDLSRRGVGFRSASQADQDVDGDLALGLFAQTKGEGMSRAQLEAAVSEARAKNDGSHFEIINFLNNKTDFPNETMPVQDMSRRGIGSGLMSRASKPVDPEEAFNAFQDMQGEGMTVQQLEAAVSYARSLNDGSHYDIIAKLNERR